MRKVKPLILFLIIIVVCFIGCSTVNLDEEEEEDDGEFPIPDIKEIQFWSFGGSLNREIADDLIEGFNLDNPEFTLTIRLDNVGVSQVAQTLAAGKGIPDLVNHHAIKEFYYANLLQSMEPYIALDPAFDRTDFHHLVNAFNTIGPDGDLWSLTTSSNLLALFYNKDMFEICGIDSEQPPVRWSDMLETQKALTQIDDKGRISQTGFADLHLQNDGGRMWCAVGLYDGTNYIDDYGGFNYRVNSDAMYELILFYRELAAVYGGNTSKMIPTLSGRNPGDAFKAGLVGMIFNHYLDLLIGRDFRVGIAAFPNSELTKPNIYVNTYPQDSYMIIRNCENPEGAWFYLSWYNKVGMVMYVEQYRYQLDPTTYFPRFMTHQYTRMRIGELYYDEISRETLENIEKRDDLMISSKMIYNYEPTIPEQRNTLFQSNVIPMAQNPAQFGDIKSRLSAIQKLVDLQRDNWLRDHEIAGWVFTDEYPWGYPPSLEEPEE